MDPCRLARQVNEIPSLDLNLKTRQDPCHLAWQVNKILRLESA